MGTNIQSDLFRYLGDLLMWVYEELQGFRMIKNNILMEKREPG